MYANSIGLILFSHYRTKHITNKKNISHTVDMAFYAITFYVVTISIFQMKFIYV